MFNTTLSPLSRRSYSNVGNLSGARFDPFTVAHPHAAELVLQDCICSKT